MNFTPKKLKARNAQVMLASVMILGGILASATAIAGILMVYQIRQANDAENSAQALFAADSGIEAATLCFTKPDKCGTEYTVENPPLQKDFREFTSKAVTFEIKKTEEVVGGETETIITSRGLVKNTIRILEAVLVEESGRGEGMGGYPKIYELMSPGSACVGRYAAIRYITDSDLSWVEVGGTDTNHTWQGRCSTDPNDPNGPRETKKWRWSKTDSPIRVCTEYHDECRGIDESTGRCTGNPRGRTFDENCTPMTSTTPNGSITEYTNTDVRGGLLSQYEFVYSLESTGNYSIEHQYE